MGVIPTVSSEAFERWPERLSAAGYAVDVKAHDEELGVGVVSKGGQRLSVSLLRSKSGSTAVLASGRCRKGRAFLAGIVAVMETPLP